MKKLFSKRCPLITIISVLVGFIGIVGVAIFVLSQIFAKIEHEKKWSEYDECGVF